MRLYYTLVGSNSTTTFDLTKVECVVATVSKIIIIMYSGAKIEHGTADLVEARSVHDGILKAMSAFESA